MDLLAPLQYLMASYYDVVPLLTKTEKLSLLSLHGQILLP